MSDSAVQCREFYATIWRSLAPSSF